MIDAVWMVALLLILFVIAISVGPRPVRMRNAIKEWIKERWIRLVSKLVVNQIIVQPVEYYPKGLVCSYCIELEKMRPHGWPTPAVNGEELSGDGPRKTGQSLSSELSGELSGDSPQRTGQSLSPQSLPGAGFSGHSLPHAFGCPCPWCQLIIDERLDELEAVKALVFDIFGGLFVWHTKKEARY